MKLTSCEREILLIERLTVRLTIFTNKYFHLIKRVQQLLRPNRHLLQSSKQRHFPIQQQFLQQLSLLQHPFQLQHSGQQRPIHGRHLQTFRNSDKILCLGSLIMYVYLI